MKRYLVFLIGLLVSTSMYLVTGITHANYFKAYLRFLAGLESRHLDVLVFPVTVLFLFSIAQLLVNRRYEIIEAERAKIYRAMLRSTHHVLNNFLNNMLLFRITADRTPEFPKEVLQLFDQVIRDAEAQIVSLGSIERINVKNIQESVAPKAKG